MYPATKNNVSCMYMHILLEISFYPDITITIQMSSYLGTPTRGSLHTWFRASLTALLLLVCTERRYGLTSLRWPLRVKKETQRV